MKTFIVQWVDQDEQRQQTEVKLESGDRFDAMDFIYDWQGKVLILRVFEVDQE